MAFCKYCGKQLNDGEVCSCQTPVVEQPQQQAPAAPQQAPVAPQPQAMVPPQQAPVMGQPQQMGYQGQPQMGYQGQPQMNYQQPNPQAEAAKAHAKEAKNAFVDAIKHPYSAMGSSATQTNYIPGLIVGAVHLLLIFLCTTINIPLVGEFLEAGGRAKIAFYFLLVVAVPVLLFALAGLLLGKKTNPNVTFLSSLAVFGLATVPGSILFVGSFVLGLVSPAMAVLLLVATYFAWILTSIEAMNVVMKGNRNIIFWIVIATHMICLILLVLVGKSVAQDLLEDAMSSLGSLGGLLGL